LRRLWVLALARDRIRLEASRVPNAAWCVSY